MAKEVVPNILVMGPPMVYKDFESRYSESFNFLRFFASSLPLPHFLSSLNIHESSIPAILCNPLQRVSADILRSLPSLGLVVTTSTGTDHIDLAECRRLGVRVANAAGVYTDDVADLAVGLFIDVLMNISAANRCLRKFIPSKEHRTPPPPPPPRVGGKRVGIVGLGKIGRQVAKRLQSFGCKIMYTSRTKKSSVTYPFYGSIVELATNSDVLVLCCALTGETHHIVNKEVMEALGKEGVIVNVGRGSLIDEKEMVRRLLNGGIGGAGLDVFENEPLVPKELLSLDSVVLSPHAASNTFESKDHIMEIASSNLHAFFEDRPLLTPVVQDLKD